MTTDQSSGSINAVLSQPIQLIAAAAVALLCAVRATASQWLLPRDAMLCIYCGLVCPPQVGVLWKWLNVGSTQTTLYDSQGTLVTGAKDISEIPMALP